MTTSPNVNPTGRTAVEKLQVSQLSDQREGLRDVDPVEIELYVDGVRVLNLAPWLVSPCTLQRTVLGASSLTLSLNDAQRRFTRSGIFGEALTIADDFNESALGRQISFGSGHRVDVLLDGLWFRAVQWVKKGNAVTITLEDREIAVLRSYPKKGDANTYQVFPPSWTRIRVMRWLVQEPTEFGTPIRLVSPFLAVPNAITGKAQAPSQTHRDVSHAPGFPPDGGGVTVKGQKASQAQLQNLAAVLETGRSMGVDRELLVCSVMTITQESDAQTSATNGTHVGLFQQDSDPKSSWPKLGGATRDPYADAHAFFTEAIPAEAANPSADYWIVCEAVQHSGQGTLYAQWRAEAENTVSVYTGTDVGNPFNGSSAPVVSSGNFYRGSVKTLGDVTKVVREDNWVTLQRLASEVGWRCFVVSGTVYISDDHELMSSRIRDTFDEDTDGVDAIDGNVFTSRAQAVCTVTARAKTWQCPPGSVFAVQNTGPLNGRWLVQTIARDLFDPTATITGAKPQPTLLDAESAVPIQATSYPLSGTTGQPVPVGPGTAGEVATRAAIKEAALKAVALQKNAGAYRYAQVRPMPASLFAKGQSPFGPTLTPELIDCSAFATLVFKAAGAPDPNGFGFNGQGNTATLWRNGYPAQTPNVGDLVFYGYEPALGPEAPAHVAVYIGNGQIVNMGSPGEPVVLDVNTPGLPTPLRGYRTYPLGGPA